MKNEPKISAATNPAAVVDRAAFAAAIEKIKLVTETRQTLPILSNVKLAAEAGDLVLHGTDLDMEIRIRVAGEVDGRISTSVPVALLASMCAKAPKSERVTITLTMPSAPAEGDNSEEAETARFEFGKMDYRLITLPATDFPVIQPFAGKTHRFALPGSTFWNAFDAVKAAISTEETRNYLNGIYFHVINDQTYKYDDDTEGFVKDGGAVFLRATATDGHRLYSQTMNAVKGCIDIARGDHPLESRQRASQAAQGQGSAPLGQDKNGRAILRRQLGRHRGQDQTGRRYVP